MNAYAPAPDGKEETMTDEAVEKLARNLASAWASQQKLNRENRARYQAAQEHARAGSPVGVKQELAAPGRSVKSSDKNAAAN